MAVLASGSGTVADALLVAGLPIVAVLVDRPCRATEVATKHRCASVLVARDRFDASFDRVAFTHRLLDVLAPLDVDLVVMAGFMTVLAEPAFERYPEAITNTHPSLLPSFPGAHAVRDALAYGVKVTGCTVHLATVQVDHGPILAQEAVPVVEGDDEATLHERIKAVERRLYPATLEAMLR